LKTKVEKASTILFKLERKLNASFASNFKTSIEHRTLLDTIRHANMWKMSALEIVRKRVSGKEAYFHNEAELVEIDDEIYVVTCEENYRQTLSFIEQVEDIALSVFKGIKGKENSTDWSPLGFDGTVLEYLLHALVERPVRRYLYYGLRNNEYDLFVVLQQFLIANWSELFNKDQLFDLSVFYDSKTDKGLFLKTGEWISNSMYIEIKSRTQRESGNNSME